MTLLRRDAKAREIVREVHPELCFWALNDRKPMCYSKRAKARAGFDERMAVLGACGRAHKPRRTKFAVATHAST